jgi:enoyl-CoA hydratase/carnithine racemase
MDMQFFSEIGKVFDELDNDGNVRAIILWAEGKIFTAGLDLKSSAEIFSKNHLIMISLTHCSKHRRRKPSCT